MSKKVLITGFEPFEDYPINFSYEAVKRLPERIGEYSIVTMEVPVVFGESIDLVVEKLESEQPDAVLLVGQAGEGTPIAVERVAINIDDAHIPDNKGNQPIDTLVKINDLPAYFSTLPIKAIVAQIMKNDIPARVSNTAGAFVCNHLMFGVLSHIKNNELDIKCGFIHVPYIPEQGKTDESRSNDISLSDIAQSLEVAVAITLAFEEER